MSGAAGADGSFARPPAEFFNTLLGPARHLLRIASMLKRVTRDVWCVEAVMKPSGAPLRMTVLRHGSGLLLYSPVRLSDAVAGDLQELGPVTDIVAPNSWHHMFIGAAKERFPDANVWGPRALIRRQPGVPICHVLDDDVAPDWPPDVQRHMVAGVPYISETVLYHGTSRTLVVSDLVLNVRSAPLWRTRTVFRLMNAYGGAKHAFMWRLMCRDAAAARRSAETILAWDFQRVMLSHGDIITGDAHGIMTRALARMSRRGNGVNSGG